MAQFSPQLTRLLLIRGAVRAITPIFILWGILDWYAFDRGAEPPRFPYRALIFALLTGNYILVYILTWTAPNLLNGPWRVRPWQTFVLLINVFLLPIQYYYYFHVVLYGYIAISVLFFVGLYVATAILFHLKDKLPMAGIFAMRKGQGSKPASAVAEPGTQTTA
jgi:hypothetical protein